MGPLLENRDGLLNLSQNLLFVVGVLLVERGEGLLLGRFLTLFGLPTLVSLAGGGATALVDVVVLSFDAEHGEDQEEGGDDDEAEEGVPNGLSQQVGSSEFGRAVGAEVVVGAEGESQPGAQLLSLLSGGSLS
uniref:Uncharacterized protein n=1 Tax=Strombidium rassoulzadegani TaxID=1082188 RepID=A0A7S3FXN7_9SPIT